jgi:hypothetical protein
MTVEVLYGVARGQLIPLAHPLTYAQTRGGIFR